MIQTRTILNITDNTGAKQAMCFGILGGTKKRYAQIGDIVVVAVKSAEPRKIVKKHEVVRAVVVRQKKPFRRNDGTYIRFDENSAVVLEGKTKEPKGNRITGPIPRELREKGFEKIASLAEELI
jgi:large subunit ribosomal protein L14